MNGAKNGPNSFRLSRPPVSEKRTRAAGAETTPARSLIKGFFGWWRGREGWSKVRQSRAHLQHSAMRHAFHFCTAHSNCLRHISACRAPGVIGRSGHFEQRSDITTVAVASIRSSASADLQGASKAMHGCGKGGDLGATQRACSSVEGHSKPISTRPKTLATGLFFILCIRPDPL